MKELEKNYNQSTENDIYELWESSGLFQPENALDSSGEPYTILMPPPNANGYLHVGHALFVTIEDILTRYHRMKGYRTLWLPGTDHAGFGTQYVFEKVLEKEGTSRLSLTREEFYQRTLDFTMANQKNLVASMKRVGASADWSRAKFMLDEDIVAIVYATFRKLFRDGLIYRAKKLVNYSFKFRSTLSDLEISYLEKEGKLYYIHYPIKGSSETLRVATTRPETMLGDTAIAVHPKDKRYKSLIGKKVIVPLVGREVPVVADEVVDMEFGTGAVKVTPAHDQNDFEIGERHQLPMVQVIGFNGRMEGESVPEKYAGLKIEEARELVIDDLEGLGLLEMIEPIVHRVAVDEKSESPVEPLPMPQWFVATKDLAKKALQKVESDETVIIPENYSKVFANWINNIRDWNISRQIWWGISIPAWYCLEDDADNLTVRVADKRSEWHIIPAREYLGAKENYDAATLTLARASENAKPLIEQGKLSGDKTYLQDPDTFDTWFSSGQWPYATLGFNPETGEAGEDFKTFYPTTVMETGRDIIFFWVARMMMLSLYATGKVPFKTVYLHGMVNDSEGKKMSKSKGNVVDPMDLIEKYGADALRLALVIGNTAGADQALSEDKVRGYRNFANKLWNISRFVGMTMKGDETETLEDLDEVSVELLKEWTELKAAVAKHLAEFRFDLAADGLYHFTWHSLADKYVEYSKDKTEDIKVRSFLLYLLKDLLKVLHPFVPFVTEAIWKEMGFGGVLMGQRFPES